MDGKSALGFLEFNLYKLYVLILKIMNKKKLKIFPKFKSKYDNGSMGIDKDIKFEWETTRFMAGFSPYYTVFETILIDIHWDTLRVRFLIKQSSYDAPPF